MATALKQAGGQAWRGHAKKSCTYAIKHLYGQDAPGAVPQSGNAAAQRQRQQGQKKSLP